MQPNICFDIAKTKLINSIGKLSFMVKITQKEEEKTMPHTVFFHEKNTKNATKK